MDFVKKHYEKIILVAVLLGVVGFLVFLPIMISSDQADLEKMRQEVTTPKVVQLPELMMTNQQNILDRLQLRANFDFTKRHKLFNPIEWKKDANGVMFPIKNGNEVGAGAAVVTKITPLYLVITLDQVVTNTASATNAADVRYAIGLEHQAAATRPLRVKQTRYASVKEKKDLFTLDSVKGDPLNPDQVNLTLTDTGEKAVVSKDKPFQRVDAYTADLKYGMENKTFAGRRVGSTISFNGEDYIIVAIHANEVILSGQSNQKNTTLPYTP